MPHVVDVSKRKGCSKAMFFWLRIKGGLYSSFVLNLQILYLFVFVLGVSLAQSDCLFVTLERNIGSTTRVKMVWILYCFLLQYLNE